jgi:hypothetical protein
MDVEEMKKLMKAADELEAQFAKQKADYEAKKEALQAALYRMGQEMIATLEGLPPDKWPKGVVPVAELDRLGQEMIAKPGEGSVKEDR